MYSVKCEVCKGGCTLDVVSNMLKYYVCDDCGTSQVVPKPTNEVLTSFYSSFHLGVAEGGIYDEVESRMQADFPRKVEIAKSLAQFPNARLLDVGCGKGYFVQAAQAAGFVAEGIDLSSSGVEFAVNRLNVKATCAAIQDCVDTLEWRETFDVVTLWATIEHLADPAAVLSAIISCLKPGGYLLCDTGIRGGSFEKYLIGHNQWYDAPQHLFVFSSQGLIRLLEGVGFKVESIDENFERSLPRRFIKYVRHAAICGISRFLPGALLGRPALRKAKIEMKWPLGMLQMAIAKKPEIPS